MISVNDSSETEQSVRKKIVESTKKRVFPLFPPAKWRDERSSKAEIKLWAE